MSFRSCAAACLAPTLVLGLLLGVTGCSGGGNGAGGTSTALTAPSIATQPMAVTAYIGDTASFSVSASGSSPFAYQWMRGGTAISGANSATYNTAALTAGDDGAQFSVSISNSAGSATSQTAKLTVQAKAPSITSQPASTTAVAGATATFTVAASGTPTLSFQWTRNGTAIAGATASTYTTGALSTADNGALFAVVVSNNAGAVTSQTATLTVQVQAPSITTQPANQSVTAGSPATFTVTATGSPTLAYQWYRGNTAVAGATASSYTVSVTALSDDSSSFAVKVSNAAGSVTSTAATLSVKASPVSIVTQPGNLTVFPKESATFTVTAAGTAPTYQWRRNGATIPGATSASYTISSAAASDDTASFDVVVTNTVGFVTSTAAVLRVAPFATTYKAIYGATLNLYAWPGVKTAILTGSNTVDPQVMRKFLTASDATYAYYAKTVGIEPSLYVSYNGLATVAEIPASQTTCGAGCTYVGATGMEMWDPYFNWIVYSIPNGSYDQIMFYEYGRSFWLFPQLAFASGDDNSCLVTGFAVLMRKRSLDALGYQGNSNSFATSASDTAAIATGVANYNTYITNMTATIDAYSANSSLNWSNTFLKNSYTGTGGTGCSDLFTSLVQQVASKYGGETFIQSLWKQVLLRPKPTSTQDAIDNFVLAASAAANHNLVELFTTTYKWPVSTTATNEATSKYGKP